MNEFLEKTITVEGCDGPITLSYRLCPTRGAQQGVHYGILVMDQTAETSMYIADITTDLLRAMELFQALVRGTVTTVTFRDVVEDYLAAG